MSQENYDRYHQLVNTLKTRHPDMQLSLGYIGNVSPAGDHRYWYVFTQVPADASRPLSASNKVKIYLGPTQALETECDRILGVIQAGVARWARLAA